MKKLFITLVAAIALTSCKDNSNQGQIIVNDYQPSQVSVTPEVANLGDNLNLQALGELVKNSTSAQDIEDKLNSTGSINNLDLNGDGTVDYIKVTEYGDANQKGFSFSVDVAEGQTQEIATIEVSQGSNDAQMNIQGNQELYGNNGYYQSRYSLTDMMIISYLFRPHPYYHSPYYYGHYPTYYRSYRITPYNSYRNRISTTTRTTKITRTTRPTTTTRSASPNANKSVSTVTARAKSLSTPTRSQKAFTTTSTARQKPSTSGFKNTSSSSPRKSSSSWGSSSSSRKSSGSSWGGSSSRKSSGSSWGGSSRSSSRSSSSRRR